MNLKRRFLVDLFLIGAFSMDATMAHPPAMHSGGRLLDYNAIHQFLEDKIAYSCGDGSWSTLNYFTEKSPFVTNLFTRLNSEATVAALLEAVKTKTTFPYIRIRIHLFIVIMLTLLALGFAVFLLMYVPNSARVRHWWKAFVLRRKGSADSVEMEDARQYGKGQSNAFADHSLTDSVRHRGRQHLMGRNIGYEDGGRGSAVPDGSLLSNKTNKKFLLQVFILTVVLVLYIYACICARLFSQSIESLECRAWVIVNGHFFGAQHLVGGSENHVPTNWRGSFSQRKHLESLLANVIPLHDVEGANATRIPEPLHQLRSLYYAPNGLKQQLELLKDTMMFRAYGAAFLTASLDNVLRETAPTTSGDGITNFRSMAPPYVANGRLVIRLLIDYAQQMNVTVNETLTTMDAQLDAHNASVLLLLRGAERGLRRGLQILDDVDWVMNRGLRNLDAATTRFRFLSRVVLGVVMGIGAGVVVLAVANGAIGLLYGKGYLHGGQAQRWSLFTVLAGVVFALLLFLLFLLFYVGSVVASDASALLEDQLFEKGAWTLLPPDMWKSTPSNKTDMTVVLDTCVNRNGNGDVATPLGLRKDLEQSITAFQRHRDATVQQLEESLAVRDRKPKIITLVNHTRYLPDLAVIVPPLQTPESTEHSWLVNHLFYPHQLPLHANYVALRKTMSKEDPPEVVAMLNLFGQQQGTFKEVYQIASISPVIRPIGYGDALKILNGYAIRFPQCGISHFCFLYLGNQTCAQLAKETAAEQSASAQLKKSDDRSHKPLQGSSAPGIMTFNETREFMFGETDSSTLINDRKRWACLVHQFVELKSAPEYDTLIRLGYLLKNVNKIFSSHFPKKLNIDLPEVNPAAVVLHYFNQRGIPNDVLLNTTSSVRRFLPDAPCASLNHTSTTVKSSSFFGWWGGSDITSTCTVGDIIEPWARYVTQLSKDIYTQYEKTNKDITSFVMHSVKLSDTNAKSARKSLDNSNCQFLGTGLDNIVRRGAVELVFPQLLKTSFWCFALMLGQVAVIVVGYLSYRSLILEPSFGDRLEDNAEKETVNDTSALTRDPTFTPTYPVAFAQ